MAFQALIDSQWCCQIIEWVKSWASPADTPRCSQWKEEALADPSRALLSDHRCLWLEFIKPGWGVSCEERVVYGKEHKDKPVEDFWSYIFFTDEAHIDSTSQAVGDILREQEKRYNDENTQERERS
jgi:hypothetical protein